MTLIIFTDLDGTLLDHDTYSFAPALPALIDIKSRGYPLILTSSKTRVELHRLQQALQLDYPFISENGAAVHWQENGEWLRKEFSTPRQQLIDTLQELRKKNNYRFTAFMDCTNADIAELTGLPLSEAALAAQREYTEPLRWDDSPERLTSFLQQLAEHELQGIQGGRFLSIMGKFDKANAMEWLVNRYQTQPPPTVVALGDSPNDEAMLQAADIAVIIRSDRSDQLHVDQPAWVIRTTDAGPAGWQDAMTRILQRDAHDQSAAKKPHNNEV